MKNSTRSPLESFRQLQKLTRFVSGAVGMDVLDANYRTNWLTGAVIASVVAYFAFTVSTIVQISEDLTHMLESSCMVGSVLQGVFKMITAIFDNTSMRGIVVLLDELYKEYEVKGPRYRRTLQATCDNCRKVLISIGIFYAFASAGIISMPFVMLLLDGSHYLMMHFHLPGLSVDTDSGYFCTLAAHSTCVLFASFGLFAGDIFVLISFSHCYFFVDIFKLKIEELNVLLENAENRFKPEINERLIDIVRWHQLYSEFTEMCNRAYYLIITSQVTTSGVSIVLTIFVLLTSDWPGGYAYLPITILNLYVYCILGTKIEICNDQFTSEIYNILWYNMTPAQQKVIRLMLMQSQTPNMVNIAGVMPLSVSTALQITKTIYSITMMMVQFLVK